MRSLLLGSSSTSMGMSLSRMEKSSKDVVVDFLVLVKRSTLTAR
jgi:hypothetical protein